MSASYKRITLQFNAEEDADVIEYLEAQPNKVQAIRAAIRAVIDGMRSS